MNPKTALHTLARSYCQERYLEWTEKYEEVQTRERLEDKCEPGWDYSEGEYRIFPRYRIAAAILVEIERLIPDSIPDLGKLRYELICAADTAETQLSVELNKPVEREAILEETDNYRAYIQVLGERDFSNVAPLPYRRVLNKEESKKLWKQLKLHFDIGDDYWFPLRKDTPSRHVIAFHTDYFGKRNGLKILHDALHSRGISRIFQLHELGSPEYEVEVTNFKPSYACGAEQYSTSELCDWVVYASHESSITIAGGWLVEIFKEKWPGCEGYTYGGPFSTDDLRGTWKWE